MSISERIQNLRKSKGLSQEELAEKIDVSRQAVSKWETGQSVPDIDKIIILSEYFNTSTDYILKGTQLQNKTKKQLNSMLFCVFGTFFNIKGLLCAISIYIEKQIYVSTAIGLILMSLGTSLFITGQFINSQNKKKAIKYFALINVWVLSFIPLSFCFNTINNFLNGIIRIELAPIPIITSPIWTIIIYIIFYFALCITSDIIILKRE